VLHLRLTVPPDRTDTVVALLEAEVGVTNLMVLRGAMSKPLGDMVQADVVREAAQQVLAGLRALGIDRDGAIEAIDVDFALSSRMKQAEDEAPGSSVDAVIWEQVRRRTQEEATLSATYLVYMSAAMLIAATGIMTDSAILIVAAMVVGPDFGPIAGTAVGIATRRWHLARRSLLAVVVGFAVGIAATLAYTVVMGLAGVFSESDLDATRPATAFIYDPNLLSAAVAVIAGIVGMLSLTTAKSGALVGVFISVTTIPAAANAALAMAYRDPQDQVWGSLGQLTLNVTCIITAGVATLVVQQAWQRHGSRTSASAAA
jgi:uncharacterized hydrophobic protein (TIGR00271 family)